MKAQERLLKEYNHVRPHEVLGMETPVFMRNFSTRSFPDKTREFDYASNFRVFKVSQNGAIRWKSYFRLYLTTTLKR